MKNVFIFCALICVFSCNQDHKINQRKAGLLPSFDLLLIDSTTIFHSSNIAAGSPLIFMYFRPDCNHCHKETQTILKHINAFKNSKIFLLTSGSIPELKEFDHTYKLSGYKNILLAKDYDYSFYKKFRPKAVPYIIIYDKEKRLIDSHEGDATNINEIIEQIKS